jgi:hypothetical protein
VKARATAALTFCAAVLLATASSASAEAVLEVQLDRAPAPSVPVTHSDERLAYEVTVSNTASKTPAVGSSLKCLGTPAEGIDWKIGNPAPTFAYRWLRNGAPIAGEGGPWPSAPAVPTYTLVADDAGKSIQCEVTATNDADGAGTAYEPISAVEITRPPVQVEPIPSPAPPSGTSKPALSGGTQEKGATLICTAPGGWSGTGIAWSFQWLRNSEAAPHTPSETTATTSKYELLEEDVSPPASIQCLAIAKDAGGNEAAAVSSPLRTFPKPPSLYTSPFPPSGSSPQPKVTFNNQTEGKVTVTVEFPAGTEAIQANGTENGGSDWSCTKAPDSPGQPSTISCSREDGLQPGGDSYDPILFVAQVSASAPDDLTTKACASGGGALNVPCGEDTVAGILPAVPFGFEAFKTSVLGEAGADFTQAGGHPFEAGAQLAFTDHVKPQKNAEAGFRAANGFAREIRTEVPPGFVGNPEALGEKCPSSSDVVAIPTSCPAASAVGGISFKTSSGEYDNQPIYAMEPERGTPAQFAFGVGALKPGFVFTLSPELRPGDSYAVTLIASPGPKTPELFEATATLCGRGAKIEALPKKGGGETGFIRCWKASDPQALEKPFLTLPTKCGDEASSTTRILADTWEDPGNYAEARSTIAPPEGCESLQFEPELKARPTTNAAGSPTGLEVDLQVPQNEGPAGTATAQLKKAVVTLPEGLVVNPSAANGLSACSPSQIGLGNNNPNSCPPSSKVGTVSVTTPILGHPLPGSLYVASPHDNPFNSLLALYLVVESPDDGLVIKLPGKVEANQATGQLTTSFDQNPQAPVSDVQLKIRGGATAPLRTPSTCAKYTTTSELTPWSAPDSGPPAKPKDSWSINKGPGGGACVSSPPNAPTFAAGTTSPIAASYSPFVLKLRREDGSQQFSALNLTLPPGLAGKLAGVPYCPEAAIAAARAKSGKVEQASPSCPTASAVGTVSAGAGAGPSPYFAQGTAYLAGPYKGAPVSMVVITPAVAGPFDLGNVVVRAALKVDPESAQISAVSDPLPTILQGIPLDVRAITIEVDRPEFTFNPTSCDPMAITGALTSTLNQVAQLNNRFQVGECSRLGFKPKLAIKLKGKTKRSGHPALTATLTMPSGGANIGAVSVALPHSEFLEQAHIRTICTRVQFAADQCPKGAVYGHVKVFAPLFLDQPLEGPVYLRSSSNPLPDLVAAIQGPPSLPVKVAVVGRIDSVNGGIRTTFDSFPDLPFAKATLSMQGGAKGLLVNSRDICKHPNKASAAFTGQNGKTLNAKPVLKAQCAKKAKQHDRRRGAQRSVR